MKEIWKSMKIMLDKYEISSSGRIRNAKTLIILKSYKSDGYSRIRTFNNKAYYIHRLVAIHFIDNPNTLPTVDHIDRNRSNNNVQNLRWASYKTQSTNIGKRGRLKRKVAKIDKITNKVISKYDSITNAAYDLPNSDRRLISAVCRGKRKTHAGFKWKYMDIAELENEQWIHMKEYDGNMHISKYGRIRFKDGRISTGHLAKKYRRIHLKQNGKDKHILVHRLVATYFLENANNYPIVNHKDGDKSNNNVDNLEWCTYSHNTLHAYKTGLIPSKKYSTQNI